MTAWEKSVALVTEWTEHIADDPPACASDVTALAAMIEVCLNSHASEATAPLEARVRELEGHIAVLEDLLDWPYDHQQSRWKSIQIGRDAALAKPKREEESASPRHKRSQRRKVDG